MLSPAQTVIWSFTRRAADPARRIHRATHRDQLSAPGESRQRDRGPAQPVRGGALATARPDPLYDPSVEAAIDTHRGLNRLRLVFTGRQLAEGLPAVRGSTTAPLLRNEANRPPLAN